MYMFLYIPFLDLHHGGGDATGVAAEHAPALNVGSGEVGSGALDGADTLAVLDGAGAGLDVASTASGGARGNGSSRSGGSSAVGSSTATSTGGRRSNGGAASDGAGGTLAGLGDGSGLEISSSLLSSRVDGEDHALSTVTGLGTVEPQRLSGHDLHSDLGRGDDAVIRVGLEAGSLTTGKRLAGLGKGRLGGGVVLVEEGEDNHVADSSLDLGGSVDEAGGTTNSDLVGDNGSGGSSGSTSGTGTSSLSDGLGDSDGLVYRGSGSDTTGVGPDDNDLSTGRHRDTARKGGSGGLGSGAMAAALLDGREDVVDGLCEGDGRGGQGESSSESHLDGCVVWLIRWKGEEAWMVR